MFLFTKKVEKLEDQQADHALVFMFSSLRAKFNQPIGVFASKTTSSLILAKLILAAITSVENAGGKVIATVCDGAQTNRGVWKEFGISGKVNRKIKHSFPNPVAENREICVISDVPHLFKCIRNNLYNRKTFLVS